MLLAGHLCFYLEDSMGLNIDLAIDVAILIVEKITVGLLE